MGGNSDFFKIANLFVFEVPWAIFTKRNSGSNSVTVLPPQIKEGIASFGLYYFISTFRWLLLASSFWSLNQQISWLSLKLDLDHWSYKLQVWLHLGSFHQVSKWLRWSLRYHNLIHEEPCIVLDIKLPCEHTVSSSLHRGLSQWIAIQPFLE